MVGITPEANLFARFSARYRRQYCPGNGKINNVFIIFKPSNSWIPNTDALLLMSKRLFRLPWQRYGKLEEYDELEIWIRRTPHSPSLTRTHAHIHNLSLSLSLWRTLTPSVCLTIKLSTIWVGATVFITRNHIFNRNLNNIKISRCYPTEIISTWLPLIHIQT